MKTQIIVTTSYFCFTLPGAMFGMDILTFQSQEEWNQKTLLKKLPSLNSCMRVLDEKYVDVFFRKYSSTQDKAILWTRTISTTS